MLRLHPSHLAAFGRRIPVTIGKSGTTNDKREGDGATPLGHHRITGLLFRPDRLRPPAPWAEPIRPGDLWSDAPDDTSYNTRVRAPYTASHEILRRPDPLYDVILLTDWNATPAMPHRGSAIFLHQWRRPGFPTEGCIAMARADIHWLAARAAPGTPLIVTAPARPSFSS